jgi:hypothetical protein
MNSRRLVTWPKEWKRKPFSAVYLGLSLGFIAPKLGKVLGLHVHREA